MVGAFFRSPVQGEYAAMAHGKQKMSSLPDCMWELLKNKIKM